MAALAQPPNRITRDTVRTYLSSLSRVCPATIQVTVGEVGLVQEEHIQRIDKLLSGTGLKVDRSVYEGTLLMAPGTTRHAAEPVLAARHGATLRGLLTPTAAAPGKKSG